MVLSVPLDGGGHRADDAAPVDRAEKMTFKDRHELGELPERIAGLERQVMIHETALADPQLYAAGPEAAAKLGAQLDTIRADLAAAEDRWLELSEREEALAG